jgi:hypothetical protein
VARTPKRLAGPAQIATGPATIYTVPAGTKAIVRYIAVQNPSGSPVTLTLSIGADGASKRIWDAFSVPAQAAGVTANVIDRWCYLVLEAAEVIQVASGANNVLTITINGDELTLG